MGVSGAGADIATLGMIRGGRSWLRVLAVPAALCAVPRAPGPVWLQLAFHLSDPSAIYRQGDRVT